MEFMLVFYRPDAEVPPDLMQEMGKFAGELAQQDKMLGGAPLHPDAEGARIRVEDGTPTVTDGPFTETKEVIGGYFMIDADSRDEAIDIAKRCPHARIGTVEVRQVIPMGPPPGGA